MGFVTAPCRFTYTLPQCMQADGRVSGESLTCGSVNLTLGIGRASWSEFGCPFTRLYQDSLPISFPPPTGRLLTRPLIDCYHRRKYNRSASRPAAGRHAQPARRVALMPRQSQPEYDVFPQSDVMVTLRDGVRLATDLYFPARNGKPVAGRFPRRHGANALQQGDAAQPRRRPVLRQPGLRRHLPGQPRQVQVRRLVRKIPERPPGRLRHAGVDRQPALVQRPRRHLRHLLRRPHPGRDGRDQPAQPGLHFHGLRRLHQRLRQLLPQQRHAGVAPGLLGLHPRAQQQRGARRPHRQGRAGGRRPSRVVPANALEEGPVPPALGARLRGLRLRHVDAGRLRRVLAADRHLQRAVLRPVRRHPPASPGKLVRPIHPHDHSQLHGALPHQEQPHSHGAGAVDPRRARRELLRRRGLRAAVGGVGQPGRRLQPHAAALVRPLAEGHGQRRRARRAGEAVRHGRRRRPQERRRPAEPRRPLARRAGLAARPRQRHRVLPARRRRAVCPGAPRRFAAQRVPVRPQQSRAHHRRQHLLRRRHHGGRRVPPAGRATLLRLARALPAPGLAPRRAHFPDAAARGGR